MRRRSDRGDARRDLCGILGPRKIRTRHQRRGVSRRHVQVTQHAIENLGDGPDADVVALSRNQQLSRYLQKSKKVLLQGSRRTVRRGLRGSQHRTFRIGIDDVLVRVFFTKSGYKRLPLR